MRQRKAQHDVGGIRRAVDRVNKMLKAEERQASRYFRAFLKAIGGPDPTSILLKGHLYVENELRNILRNALPRFASLERENQSVDLSFSRKMNLLRAMAMISNAEWATLKKLNGLRNASAHLSVNDTIPEITAEHVHELWKALAPSIREIFPAPYSRKNAYKTNLRNMIVSTVVTFHVRAEIKDELGIADLVRFHLTGQTVMARIEKAQAESANDSEIVSDLKARIVALPLDDRTNIRDWIREVYHY
jgi:hypothetical protein